MPWVKAFKIENQPSIWAFETGTQYIPMDFYERNLLQLYLHKFLPNE
jgi:hypothetical protein